MARQRSAKAHEQALDAAAQLFAERGIDRTSMDAIAEASGVSKATIYKHWADKEALLLEVMARISGLNERPKFNSGDSRKDLVAILSHKPPANLADRWQQISPHLIAYSARNQHFGRTWRAMVMDPPRTDIKNVLSSALKNGELSSDLDVDLAVKLLLGPMLYEKIFCSKEAPQNRRLPKQVVAAFWRAFGVQGAYLEGAKRFSSTEAGVALPRKA